MDGLGLDAGLFLMDVKQLRLAGLPQFYCGLFKVWGLLNVCRLEGIQSLHWLLEEPLIKGARMDIAGGSFPGLMQILCASKLVTLKHLVDVAGPELSDINAVAAFLGQRSARHTQLMLNRWKTRLTNEELLLLKDFKNGDMFLDIADPFPRLGITPDLEGMSGPLLDLNELENLELGEAKGKSMYKCFVKVFNKGTLNGRVDTVWRDKLGLNEEIKPVWRVLYKPPLIKRSGDLQWRILHGAVAVNAFVSIINSNVDDKCVFCGSRETIFHCFLECVRLQVLFNLLDLLCGKYGEQFTPVGFILGAGYNQKQKVKWQLLNFLYGQAKLVIYKTRKNRMENRRGQEITSLFKAFVKSRIVV